MVKERIVSSTMRIEVLEMNAQIETTIKKDLGPNSREIFVV